MERLKVAKETGTGSRHGAFTAIKSNQAESKSIKPNQCEKFIFLRQFFEIESRRKACPGKVERPGASSKGHAGMLHSFKNQIASRKAGP